MANVARAGILGLTAVACAVLAGLAALYVQGRTQPASDLAHGQSIFQTLQDPFVASVWVLVVSGAALAGFVVSIWALWRVQLGKAIPLTIAVTVLAAAATALRFPLLSVPVGLLAGAVVMSWCRYHSNWAEESGRERAA